MRNWQSLGGLVFLGSVVACATATNSGGPLGDVGGTDSSGGMGGDIVSPVGGGGSVAGGTASGGTTSATAGTSSNAFGGTGAVSAGGTSSGAGGKAGAGGSGTAGASSGGSSGTSSGSGGVSAGGTGGAATAGTGGAVNTGPCMNPKEVTDGSGSLGAGAVCLRTMMKINAVVCSNFDGRTLKVDGMPATCGAMATYTQISGYTYLEVSAGGQDFASLNWYCSNSAMCL